QIAEERAPQGFDAIESVISRAELEEIAARYKRLAGFDPKQLGSRS
ncbi:MAG: flavin-dependent oxidoreductase, partial [Alphaproteobacteria bacterium]